MQGGEGGVKYKVKGNCRVGNVEDVGVGKCRCRV